MSLIELFLVAIGLSMDAFAVAICKGLSLPKMNWKHALLVGLYFGGFQSLMPFLGFLLGSQFKYAIASFDHWIAFILLGGIGLNMIKESLSREIEDCCAPSLHPGQMLLLALATSIDALALGVTFAFLQVKILPAVSIIGFTAFVFSLIGVKAGNMFGAKYKSKAEFTGGLILIFMGGEILIDQLFGF